MSDRLKSQHSPNTPESSMEPLLSDVSSISSNTTIDSLQLPVMLPLFLSIHEINALQMNAASDIRRVLNNILLVLFRYHPCGVFESELATFYHNMCGEFIFLNADLKFLLSTHKCINVTTTKTRGLLYTLNTNQFIHELKCTCLNSTILKTYLVEHILKIFNFFPSGIAVNCFDKTFESLLQFKLSDIIPSYIHFITCIPYIICFKMQGVNIFINTFDSYRLKQFQSNKIVMSQPAGYKQLFDSLNTDLNAQQFEKAFLLKYNARICCEAPYISDILMQIRVNNKNNKSPFSEDHCSVFMGGFCHGTGIADVKYHLGAMGFVVVSCTELKYRKFGYSWVTLSNTKEADKLINLSPIQIMGNNIDIRPFINRDKQKGKPNNKIILDTMIKLLLKNENKKNGLSIRDIQPILFKTFSHRISGTDLTEIVKSNSKYLFIKVDQHGTEKIFVSH